MWFSKLFPREILNPKSLKARRKRAEKIFWIILALLLVVLMYCCSTCSDCTAGIGKPVDRASSDVSDLSVGFINGEATLYWNDPSDYVLEQIEIIWKPGGAEPTNIPKNTEVFTAPGLEEGKEYYFTVRAVDKWGNKSPIVEGGSGLALKRRGPVIRGAPTAGQVTLSWNNPVDTEYSYIEINYEPNKQAKAPIRVFREAESKTLFDLENDIEHSFYVTAVDAEGNRTPVEGLGLYISNHATSRESVVGRSSAGQVTLNWKDPLNLPFDYIETVFIPEGETPVIFTKSEETASFSGLSDIADYEFTVYAVEKSGYRRPLTGVEMLTPKIPLFDGRDAGRMTVRGVPVAGQVILNWIQPAIEDLDHIDIIHRKIGTTGRGADNTPTSVEQGIQTATIAGLADGVEYEFLAYGVDSEGNNRVITGLRLSTPVLTELSAQPVEGKVTLAWTIPNDPYLARYEISYSPDGETPVRVARSAGAYAFTDLSDSKKYTFTITAINNIGNVYAVRPARTIVTRLPVLAGKPINRQMSLAWTDPIDVRIDHVEITPSPGEKPQIVARGMESHTFTDLEQNTEYTFTIYAMDSAGNRHPVRAAKFYDPRTAFVIPQEPPSNPQTIKLNPLPWRSANSPFGDSTIYSLAFGVTANGTASWVAGGSDGKLAYSNNNGQNWSLISETVLGSLSVNAVGYGNGRWIAGGRGGRIAWSANAIVWSVVRISFLSNNVSINAIAYGNGRWVAGISDGRIISSDDNGLSWTLAATNPFGQSAINSIAFHGTRWMASGAGGKIAWSDDGGRVWIAVKSTTFGDSAINILVHDRERWLAGGYGQNMAFSTDGVVWQSLSRPFYILSMGFNGSRLLASGQGGRMAWSIDAGNNWIMDELSNNLFGDHWIQALAYGRTPGGKGRWIAVGQSGKIIYADEQ
jgi:chitodextrinase